MRNTLRSLGLAAIIGSSMLSCGEEQKPSTAPQDGEVLPEVSEAAKGLEARKRKLAELQGPATYVTQPATAVQLSTVRAPTTAKTSEPLIPTAPVSPGPMTPVQPTIPSVPGVSEHKPVRRTARHSLKQSVSDLGYFSVTDPQNFISFGGHGSKEDWGGYASLSLDARLADFLRTDAFLGYSRNGIIREGNKDLISDLGVGRAGIELVLFDNNGLYLGLGPLAGVNDSEFKNTLGFEPKSLRAALAGGRVRGSVKGLLDVYGIGLQSFEGDYESDAFSKRKKYDVRELTAGAKIHLGKGISFGGEAGEIKEENEDLAKIWKRRATGYVELKDVAGSGVSVWLMGSDYKFHARHNMNNELVEARVRFLADLGNNFYLGGSVYGTKDKLSDKNKFGGEASITYKLK